MSSLSVSVPPGVQGTGFLFFLWTFLLIPVPGRTAETPRAFAEQIRPFLRQHCDRCHDAETATSGVRVDHLTSAFEERHLRLWEGIRRQIQSEAMPPKDEPQPSADQRRSALDAIEKELAEARSRPVPKNGSARRLTAAQYRTTLRELLLLEDDVAEILPPDAVSKDGFVNNQETLALSPLLIEAYFEVAETALSRCLVDPQTRPTIQNFRMDLGTAINSAPCPDALILGADSRLLANADFLVTQLSPKKPFPFHPFVMQTKFRFIEGYRGNDTVRGWRDFDSVYHAVFACMRGSHGYPKGLAHSTVPEGLLLRPAIPSAELFGVESTYGPRANFKISLRELPDAGRFRVTVTAAKYEDGLLLEPNVAPAAESPEAVVVHLPGKSLQTVSISKAGLYQIDAYLAEKEPKPKELALRLGSRIFPATLQSPAFLLVRLPEGDLKVAAEYPGPVNVDRLVLTPLPETHELAARFQAFEKRSPQLGVHLGLRRDCGSTLNPVGRPQAVSSTAPTRYVFEGAIRNFPSPDVEKDNVNYLAGIREIGVRSEFTDGRDMPRLLVRSVEFEGPYYESWPSAEHRNIFIETDARDDELARARNIIVHFARRAFRRPPTEQEAAGFVAAYQQAIAGGARFQDAVKDALTVVLTSPQFLFLIENSKTPEAEPIDEFELASKLSYFLWNGPPDEALMKLAEKGELRSRLETETDRLIDDPKFQRFIDQFVPQWLALDKFAVLEPDRSRFPRLTRDARSELRQEPARFVQHLIRQNLPARNLVDADFVVANEVVASYYDLGARTERGFEFIAIPHGKRELGGVLSQAAILAGLSDGRESNPVKRGAWLARRIVAEPPDDPPPNVPMLKDEAKLSLRERLEQHRNQPGCAQCHSKIDPWGFPLEAFDAGGRLKTSPVDARATLPDKTEIADFFDLKRHLANDRIDQVAFSVLKHLTVYAIGRSLTYGELEALKKNAASHQSEGYRMRTLVKAVIQSPMFLEK